MTFPQVQFISSDVSYEDVLLMQEDAVQKLILGTGPEVLFFVEHAPIYTLGSSANPEDIFNKNIPTFKAGRGGQVTYHGPGQRVIYPILDLKTRGKDLRAYVKNLQYWILEVLQELHLRGHLTDDVGVWMSTPQGEAKIAAIGVRVRKWVTFHGLAFNVSPNMEHYEGIIPCGIIDKGVTSLKELGIDTSMEDVDQIFLNKFEKIFPPLTI